MFLFNLQMFELCLYSPGTQYSVIQSSKFELNPTQKPSTKNRTPGLHSSGYGNLTKNSQIFTLLGAYDKDAILPDYLEATIYNKEEAVIMVGNFADIENYEQKSKINQVTKWYKPWFYKHVETFLEKGEKEEFIPLREYLLRHDKAIFWVIESMIPFGNHPLFLFFLGWMLPPKPAFMKLTTTPTVRALTFTKQVFQDIVLPINK